MIEKVTDTHLRKVLNGQGIDADYVELLQDYASRSRGKEHSPYAQFFRDRVSGKKTMVTGILPHITNAGFFIVSKWRSVGSKFIAEENCFGAEIDNGTIQVTCVNDQPVRGKVNDQLIWHPQIYLDGAEQYCGNPLWLDTDPINLGYHFNTVEWDYGFCKRRVRTIEGRIRERWVFDSNPHKEFRVKHNHTGTLRLKMGEYKINDDEELVPVSVFDEAKYPFEVMASPETFYPDPHPETATVDGYVLHSQANQTWATIRDGVGTGAVDDGTSASAGYINSDGAQDEWLRIFRIITLFNTEPLPDDATITAVVESLYGYTKADTGSWAPSLGIYASAPATPTELVAGDFNSLGTTLFSATIAYAAWSTVGYNDFTFNATGIAATSKTAVSEFGAREATYDAIDNPYNIPTWAADKECSFDMRLAERGNDTNQDPKLVVTYTTFSAPIVMHHYKMMMGD